MNLSIIVATSDSAISRLIGVRKTSIVTTEINEKLINRGIKISASSLLLDRNGPKIVSEFFSSVSKHTDGIIIFCEEHIFYHFEKFCTSLFVVKMDINCYGKFPLNYLRSVSAKGIGAFLAFFARFNEEKTRKVILLPIRNFIGKDYEYLYHLFSDGVTTARFGQQLDEFIEQIRQRQTPKRETNYKETYIVDDERKYFRLGLERHAQAETACPPHSISCVLSTCFRFGCRFDPKIHYNVSADNGLISGIFTDCHNIPSIVPSTTHVNVFPNDYFT